MSEVVQGCRRNLPGFDRFFMMMETTDNENPVERVTARPSEEPGAGVPHAGICEGGTG